MSVLTHFSRKNSNVQEKELNPTITVSKPLVVSKPGARIGDSQPQPSKPSFLKKRQSLLSQEERRRRIEIRIQKYEDEYGPLVLNRFPAIKK